jgi:hypothetical protein
MEFSSINVSIALSNNNHHFSRKYFRTVPFHTCFGRQVKLLIPAAYAVVGTANPHWARGGGYSPFSLCVIHNEGLCPSSGNINRLMIMMVISLALIKKVGISNSTI